MYLDQTAREMMELPHINFKKKNNFKTTLWYIIEVLQISSRNIDSKILHMILKNRVSLAQ